MINLFRSLIALLVTVAIVDAVAFAHTPVDFLEVFEVEPARTITHAVELKGSFDPEKVETELVGPRYFSRSVECLSRTVKKPLAYLNWFEIVTPTVEPVREIEVLDMIRGGASKSLRIKSAEYFLSPSQLITAGAPESVPGGLDHYKAYRIVNAPSIDQDVTLTDMNGVTKRRLGKPLFVCLPVREWHHDEYFAASHPNDCFVVYQLDERSHAEKFSTLDQFGLNELQTQGHQWLCVRAALLGRGGK